MIAIRSKGVSWVDAQEYLRKLSAMTGKNFRLLSEAEWEYAARAGTTTPFHTGRQITSGQANLYGYSTYNGSSNGQYRGKTLTVGSFSPNAFGLYDMHGNVWEWVEDCWNGNYHGAPTDGTARRGGECSRRVFRGGSSDSSPGNLRAASRFRYTSGSRDSHFGFRTARTLF